MLCESDEGGQSPGCVAEMAACAWSTLAAAAGTFALVAF